MKLATAKDESYELTKGFLNVIITDLLIKEMGPDAPIGLINQNNKLRADMNMMDETVRYRLRSVLERVKQADSDLKLFDP